MSYSIRVKEVQDRFGVSEGTVLHWIRSGQLRAINVGVDPGKQKQRYKISEKALLEFEEKRLVKPPAPRIRLRRRRQVTRPATRTRIYPE